MPTPHTVCPGDCIASIAEDHGGFWETIWKDAANADLRKSRKDPNQLVPGDVVQIPDLQEKQDSRPSEKCHRFRRKGVPAKLRVRILRYDKALSEQPYRADIDGQLVEGTTDADGLIDVFIPCGAKKCTVYMGEGEAEAVYELDLGQLEPLAIVKGAKQRLHNLGYEVGVLDDTMSEEFIAALKLYQASNDVEVTGELDDATKNSLESVFGR